MLNFYKFILKLLKNLLTIWIIIQITINQKVMIVISVTKMLKY